MSKRLFIKTLKKQREINFNLFRTAQFELINKPMKTLPNLCKIDFFLTEFPKIYSDTSTKQKMNQRGKSLNMGLTVLFFSNKILIGLYILIINSRKFMIQKNIQSTIR